MKLLLIRQSSVSRSCDMRFKRAVRLSGEFFKKVVKSWCRIRGALIEQLVKLLFIRKPGVATFDKATCDSSYSPKRIVQDPYRF